MEQSTAVKRGGTLVYAATWVNLEYAENPFTKGQILWDGKSRVGKLIEPKGRQVVLGGWGLGSECYRSLGVRRMLLS